MVLICYALQRENFPQPSRREGCPGIYTRQSGRCGHPDASVVVPLVSTWRQLEDFIGLFSEICNAFVELQPSVETWRHVAVCLKAGPFWCHDGRIKLSSHKGQLQGESLIDLCTCTL